MSTSVVYYPHSIYFPGGTSLTQLSEVTPANNFQDLSEFAASEPAPQYTGTHQASPDNRFNTTQIKTVLDQCILGAYNTIKDYSAAGTVQVEFKAGKNLAVREANAGTVHIRANLESNAALIWESFSVSQGGLVQMRCRLVAIFVASTGADPMVFSTGVALSATSDVAHLFTLGKQAINGSALVGVESIEWNNNVVYEEVHSDGDGFPTYIGVRSVSPVCRIMTNDISVLNTFGTRGTALTSYNCYLRKKLKSAINVADATAEHIRLSASAGTVKAREVNSSKAMAAVDVIMAAESHDTAPVSINTATAIS